MLSVCTPILTEGITYKMAEARICEFFCDTSNSYFGGWNDLGVRYFCKQRTFNISYVKCYTQIVGILIHCARSVACNIKNTSLDSV